MTRMNYSSVSCANKTVLDSRESTGAFGRAWQSLTWEIVSAKDAATGDPLDTEFARMSDIIERWNKEPEAFEENVDPPVRIPGNRKIVFPKNGTRVDPEDPIDDTLDRSYVYSNSKV